MRGRAIGSSSVFGGLNKAGALGFGLEQPQIRQGEGLVVQGVRPRGLGAPGDEDPPPAGAASDVVDDHRMAPAREIGPRHLRLPRPRVTDDQVVAAARHGARRSVSAQVLVDIGGRPNEAIRRLEASRLVRGQRRGWTPTAGRARAIRAP